MVEGSPHPAGRPRHAKDRLVVALDTPDLPAAERLAKTLRGSVGLVKIGLELFCREGPEAVGGILGLGLPVFLDLKLHDIPNTVRAAARQAGRLGASMLTVHASGGTAMVEAAVEGSREGASSQGTPAPHVLGVTVLTSMDSDTLHEVGVSWSPPEAVVRLSRLAVSAGAGGVVCSPEEARMVREALGPGPLIVTPGVRPIGVAKDDQARTATPAAAVRAGADYLVIGRPIRTAEDPVAAALSIAEEISPS